MNSDLNLIVEKVSLPRPLFDRILAEQYESVDYQDDICIYLPYLVSTLYLRTDPAKESSLSNIQRCHIFDITDELLPYLEVNFNDLWDQLLLERSTSSSPSFASLSTSSSPSILFPLSFVSTDADFEFLDIRLRVVTVLNDLIELSEFNESSSFKMNKLTNIFFNSTHRNHVYFILAIAYIVILPTSFLSVSSLISRFLCSTNNSVSPHQLLDYIIILITAKPREYQNCITEIANQLKSSLLPFSSQLSTTSTSSPSFINSLFLSLSLIASLSPLAVKNVRKTLIQLFFHLPLPSSQPAYISLKGRPSSSSSTTSNSSSSTPTFLSPIHALLCRFILQITLHFSDDIVPFLLSAYRYTSIYVNSEGRVSALLSNQDSYYVCKGEFGLSDFVCDCLIDYIRENRYLANDKEKEIEKENDNEKEKGKEKSSINKEKKKPSNKKNEYQSKKEDETYYTADLSNTTQSNASRHSLLSILPSLSVSDDVSILLQLKQNLYYQLQSLLTTRLSQPLARLSSSTGLAVDLLNLYNCLSGISGVFLNFNEITALLRLVAPLEWSGSVEPESSCIYRCEAEQVAGQLLCLLFVCCPSIVTLLGSSPHPSPLLLSLLAVRDTPYIQSFSLLLRLSVYAHTRMLSLLADTIRIYLRLPIRADSTSIHKICDVLTTLCMSQSQIIKKVFSPSVQVDMDSSLLCVRWLLSKGISHMASSEYSFGYWLYSYLFNLSSLTPTTIYILNQSTQLDTFLYQNNPNREKHLLKTSEIRNLLLLEGSCHIEGMGITNEKPSTFRKYGKRETSWEWISKLEANPLILHRIYATIYFISISDIYWADCAADSAAANINANTNSQTNDKYGESLLLSYKHLHPYPFTLLLSLPLPYIYQSIIQKKLSINEEVSLAVKTGLESRWPLFFEKKPGEYIIQSTNLEIIAPLIALKNDYGQQLLNSLSNNSNAQINILHSLLDIVDRNSNHATSYLSYIDITLAICFSHLELLSIKSIDILIRIWNIWHNLFGIDLSYHTLLVIMIPHNAIQQSVNLISMAVDWRSLIDHSGISLESLIHDPLLVNIRKINPVLLASSIFSLFLCIEADFLFTSRIYYSFLSPYLDCAIREDKRLTILSNNKLVNDRDGQYFNSVSSESSPEQGWKTSFFGNEGDKQKRSSSNSKMSSNQHNHSSTVLTVSSTSSNPSPSSLPSLRINPPAPSSSLSNLSSGIESLLLAQETESIMEIVSIMIEQISTQKTELINPSHVEDYAEVIYFGTENQIECIEMKELISDSDWLQFCSLISSQRVVHSLLFNASFRSFSSFYQSLAEDRSPHLTAHILFRNIPISFLPYLCYCSTFARQALSILPSLLSIVHQANYDYNFELELLTCLAGKRIKKEYKEMHLDNFNSDDEIDYDEVLIIEIWKLIRMRFDRGNPQTSLRSKKRRAGGTGALPIGGVAQSLLTNNHVNNSNSSNEIYMSDSTSSLSSSSSSLIDVELYTVLSHHIPRLLVIAKSCPSITKEVLLLVIKIQRYFLQNKSSILNPENNIKLNIDNSAVDEYLNKNDITDAGVEKVESIGMVDVTPIL